jgi:hypothetical protein
MPSALSPTQPAVTRDREALQSRVAGNLSMLCALGSADRIAAYLARRGVKAWRRKTAGCAIAVYLVRWGTSECQIRSIFVSLSGSLTTVTIPSLMLSRVRNLTRLPRTCAGDRSQLCAWS